mmetsp:Transcript_23159/g.52919  ORF Transcript_23159/g.52919 Transcript_23159/m.52919 type:complete len:81 (-) Transcript_23159:10-252(-)
MEKKVRMLVKRVKKKNLQQFVKIQFLSNESKIRRLQGWKTIVPHETQLSFGCTVHCIYIFLDHWLQLFFSVKFKIKMFCL